LTAAGLRLDAVADHARSAVDARMQLNAWEEIADPRTTIRAQLHTFARFAIWFLFGSRLADRFARRV
jgi:hypothetical protein